MCCFAMFLLVKARPVRDILAKAKLIKLLLLDVDGVLTDGTLFIDEQGREYKAFHARDGYGIKCLRQHGIEVAVISGRHSPSVTQRMQSLGIAHVFQGVEDKLEPFQELLHTLQIQPWQTAHVGDDLLDLPLLQRVGLAIAVHDAHPSLLAHIDWRTTLPGGRGAVREVCDVLLHAQGHGNSLLSFD